MSPQSENKLTMLDRVADEHGVAVVMLDEHSHEVSASNNNSICRALMASPDFAPKCAEFCGVAFKKTSGGDDFDYTCYAGLTCKAIPVADHGKRFVTIVGRTFTSAEKYREATDRAISGDWRDFPPNEFFENVLISSSVSKIGSAVDMLSRYRAGKVTAEPDLDPPLRLVSSRPDATAITDQQVGAVVVTEPIRPDARNVAVQKQSAEVRRRAAEAAAIRSLQNRLATTSDYNVASELLLDFVRTTYKAKSLVWVECPDNQMVPVAATGAFRRNPIGIDISADDPQLVSSARNNVPLELRERVPGNAQGGRALHIFPIVVGGEIRGCMGIEGQLTKDAKRGITRLCRSVGPQLEVLRLKHEASGREWLSRATHRLTDSLKRIDADDFWTHITQISAELVQSERASLLVQNDRAEELRAKAAVGAKIDLMAEPHVGNRVARLVLEHGKPIVVSDIGQTRIKSAPKDWKYKSGSFISYPVLLGDRRLAVLNFTDKVGGGVFAERDIELLDGIVPQIAVAIDRTTLKDMAGEFEQLSVTDALTGLLNRRYLEKRLNEEIQRSRRHRFPLSLMMLDVDNFKSYNDTFGHQAGDAALQMVANVLKDILRGVDVAARYGGEEFAILLPQTASAEAAVIAERLRQRIEHTQFPKRKVTISIGIASCSNEIETPEDIIGAADHALYEAKNHGRNNVQIYDGFGKPFNEKIH